MVASFDTCYIISSKSVLLRTLSGVPHPTRPTPSTNATPSASPVTMPANFAARMNAGSIALPRRAVNYRGVNFRVVLGIGRGNLSVYRLEAKFGGDIELCYIASYFDNFIWVRR